jgi:hypothetical protein
MAGWGAFPHRVGMKPKTSRRSILAVVVGQWRAVFTLCNNRPTPVRVTTRSER